MRLRLTIFMLAFISETGMCELFTPGAYLYVGGFNGGDYTIKASVLPHHGGDDAVIDVTVDPNTYLLECDAGSLGIGHEWFPVVADTVIDTSFTLNTEPLYSIYDPKSGSMQMWPQPFMIAFWLNAGGGLEPGEGDVFGWAEFTYDGTTLSLIDSAAENDGVGIIAGQYVQVPEPSSALLLALGSIGVLCYRRAKRHQCQLKR